MEVECPPGVIVGRLVWYAVCGNPNLTAEFPFYRVEQQLSLFNPTYNILDGGDNVQFTIEASFIHILTGA
jgi:hypothetical protein